MSQCPALPDTQKLPQNAGVWGLVRGGEKCSSFFSQTASASCPHLGQACFSTLSSSTHAHALSAASRNFTAHFSPPNTCLVPKMPWIFWGAVTKRLKTDLRSKAKSDCSSIPTAHTLPVAGWSEWELAGLGEGAAEEDFCTACAVHCHLVLQWGKARSCFSSRLSCREATEVAAKLLCWWGSWQRLGLLLILICSPLAHLPHCILYLLLQI